MDAELYNFLLLKNPSKIYSFIKLILQQIH